MAKFTVRMGCLISSWPSTIRRGGFVLSAALAVTIAGVDQKKAEDLVAAADKICPYSNAIRGNVDVGFTISVCERKS